MNSYWGYLYLSGVLAVGMTTSARFITGNGAFWPYIIFINLLLISWMLLERASMGIPWGTTFAIWATIGAVGTIVVELLFFGGFVSFWQIIFLCVIAAGVAGYSICSMPS